MLKFFTAISEEMKRFNWKLAVLFFILVTFNNMLESFIKSVMIEKVFVYTTAIWYIDFIIIFSVLFYLVWYIRNFKTFIPTTNTLFFYTFSAFLIGYYRFYSTRHWDYLNFSFTDNFKYIDAIWIIYILTIISWFKQFFCLKKPINPAFIEDKPITEEDQDELKFDTYAKEIADKINIGSYMNSFAIGINGRWGSGKTSLSNLTLKKLKTDKTNIIINFNPWASQTSQALIKDFFELVSNRISPYNKSIGKLTLQYAQKLISVDTSSIVSKIIDFTEIQNETSIEQLHKSIDRSLRKINKKLIITIDDIDRLNFDEVTEVLKLVRNTANFPNTVFILLYDRNYVSNAISKINTTNSDLFLEKIIQLEINLPYYERHIIEENLSKKIKARFLEINSEIIDNVIINKHPLSNTYISDWIINLRDVNRLVNSLLINLCNLEKEVEFGDFLKMEILRLKLPNIYDLIKNRPKDYLKHAEYSSKRHVMQLLHIENDDKKPLAIEAKIIELYKDLDKQKVVNLLISIFPDKIYYNTKSKLSIIYPSNLNRYFRYAVSDNELSEIEFSNARQKGLDFMKSKIDEWFIKNIYSEIVYKFQEIKFYDDDEDYNTIIESIIHLANKPKSNDPFRNILSYDMYDFVSKLNLYESKSDDRPKYKAYFTNIINKSKNTFTYELEFLKFLVSESGNSFILSRIELRELYVKKLKEVAKDINNMSNGFWHFYNMVKIKEWEDTGNNSSKSFETFLPEMKDTLLEIINRCDIDEVILDMIKYNFRDDDDKFKAINESAMTNIWGNKSEFRTFFAGYQGKNSKYVDEFLDFFDKCEENDFKQFIEYPFKKIPKKNN